MKLRNKALLGIGIILGLLLVGTAVTITLQSGAGGTEASGGKTPLGGLFGRARAVSNLKQQIGDLRSLHPALMEFARTHEEELPKTVAELRPYLPKQLDYLDDEKWEMPASGKLTLLMNATNANTTIFLQERDVAPGKAKIVVYADGHIEYRR
jgi:hypothetical protein